MSGYICVCVCMHCCKCVCASSCVSGYVCVVMSVLVHSCHWKQEDRARVYGYDIIAEFCSPLAAITIIFFNLQKLLNLIPKTLNFV